MPTYSRRDILRAASLGGGFVAGELWIPGAKLISIPSSGVALYNAEYDWWLKDDGSIVTAELVEELGPIALSEESIEQMCIEISTRGFVGVHNGRLLAIA